jgi:Zn-dependent protease
MLEFGVLINLVLAAFNLIPIPPLDGSHVFKYLLPPRWSIAYQQAGRYGLFILFAIISFARGIIEMWIGPAYMLTYLARTLYSSFMLPNPFSA